MSFSRHLCYSYLIYLRTPTENALLTAFVYWRRYGSREAALSDIKYKLNLYLPQGTEDAYEGLVTKMRWKKLHRCILELGSTMLATIPSELASQVNIKDFQGWTPLLLAVLVNPHAIPALLAAGANPRIDTSMMPMPLWAVMVGASSTLSILVRVGVDINQSESVSGTTALHQVADHRHLTGHNLAGALELVRHAGHLLNWDAPIHNTKRYTPLDLAREWARQHPNHEEIKKIHKLYRTRRLPRGAQYIPTSPIVDILEDHLDDDNTGLPPTSLIRAGIQGRIQLIGDLISRGAMVNERDQLGRTLLHLAALGQVPNGYRVVLELVRHGGWGVDWDALVVKGEPQNNNQTGPESGVRRHRGAKVTALEIAQARLNKDQLTEQEREELQKIRDVLEARRLPAGEKYLWPCMDPDFYKPQRAGSLPMPGGWHE